MLKKTGLSLLLLLVCQGCAGTSGVEVYAGVDPDLATKVDISNSRLARQVQTVDVRQTTVGGLLKAEVLFKSSTSSTKTLQYKWSWFDASGFEVNGNQQHWSPLIVYGGQSASVQGLAPNGGVTSFKLHIREQ